MELFVKVMFWVCVFGTVCRSIIITAKDFPYQETKRIGPILIDLIIGILFAIWSGFLLWGSK